MQAIYARQSIDKKDSLSIETQIELCQSEIGNMECKTYIDRGYSGKNTDRPQFTEMMQDIQNGLISRVTVYKLDRLSRSLLDFANMIDMFKKHHVEFQSTREKFDTSTPMGNAMLAIIMVFAQLERETIQLRVKDSFYARMAKGAYDGIAPFGYRKCKLSVHGKQMCSIEPDCGQVEIVRRIFHEYAYANKSLGVIARELNAESIPSPNGAHWDSGKLSRIMSNPIYANADADVYAYYHSKGCKIVNDVEDFAGVRGCVTYGGWDRKKRKFGQLEQLELAVGLHEGIVDSTTYLKCQYRLGNNKRITNAGQGKVSWLCGLLKCGYCGHKIRPAKSTHEFKTACIGQYNYGICHDYTRRWPIRDLEEFVEKEIFEQVKKRSDLTSSSVMGLDRIEEDFKAKIVQIDLSISRLLDALAQGNELTIQHLNAKIADLEATKRALDAEYQKYRMSRGTVDDVVRLLEVLEHWDTMTLEEKKLAARIMVDHITIYNDRIVIEWKFRFDA